MSHTVAIINGKEPSGGTGGVSDADLSEVVLDFFSKGVVTPTAYLVEEQASPNMTVKVNTGKAYVPNPTGSMIYRTHLDAAANATITANSSSNPRIDTVVIVVDTSTTPNNLASNIASIVVVPGTPAGSPTAPDDNAIQTEVGAGNAWLRLANVEVANGATSITNADITSLRESAVFRLAGGYIRYNLATSKLQSSNNGSDWRDIGSTPINLQEDTANSILSAPKIQTGWGYVQGDGDGNAGKSVTFPEAFVNAPIVIISTLARKNSSNPAAITEFSANTEELFNARNITNTGFTADMLNTRGNNVSSSVRVGFAWIAIGY